MEIEKISLPDGGTAFLDEKGEFHLGGNEEHGGAPYAQAGTVIVGKDVDDMEAACGPCRVIALINEQTKLGALVHVNIANRNHEALVSRVLQAFPELSQPGTKAVICGEKDRGRATELAEWQQSIREYLSSLGITDIAEITRQLSNGELLSVTLNTRDSLLDVVEDVL